MKGYSVGDWEGLQRFSCDACPFDTLSKGAMEAHVRKQHRTPRKTAQRKSPQTAAAPVEQRKTVATPLGAAKAQAKRGGTE